MLGAEKGDALGAEVVPQCPDFWREQGSSESVQAEIPKKKIGKFGVDRPMEKSGDGSQDGEGLATKAKSEVVQSLHRGTSVPCPEILSGKEGATAEKMGWGHVTREARCQGVFGAF